MKKNVLKVVLSLLLALSLFALASCAIPTTTNTETADPKTETTENTENTENTETEETGFAVTFVVGEHASVTIYPTQDMTSGGTENATVAYSIDKTTGKQTKSGEGQVNFVVVVESGYEIDSVTATEGTYKNIKDLGEGVWHITKIAADTTVTIATKVAE